MEHKCDHYYNGACKLGRRECYTDGIGDPFKINKDWIYAFEHLDRKDICAAESRYGNYFMAMTREDIEALLTGKCLALTGEEYNIFVVCDEEASDER